ncbi:mechanosensitive ion channel [Bermanella marisrubri]|uniref:Small-conductance mechanosensitive channel n=1 Tax=Bermanella marisrubri TaxID=207949 RepID=Q1MZE2_9GAMM|nr:mechanosensitive ion channel domain-containing protein [Bermanella marisrubri]EAT11324.1 putative mechanosensitive channel protein (MscS family) [Oceanobacter sp. RED65] [Bermanella marisrubri]QIZ85289.1 mechanosensitive ion channel [Bermanella marisrubri]
MDSIVNWVNENQELIIDHTFDALIALLIFVVGIKISSIIANLLAAILNKRNTDLAVVGFVKSLFKAILITCVIIIALSHAGVETTSFIAILGAAGLAIGLSLQGSLSNFASGILISVFRPFKAGDYIEAGGTAGIVQKIEIFFTYLNTPDNKQVVVPNSQITSSNIVNYSSNATRRVDLIIGVAYEADLREAQKVIKQCLDQHEKVLSDPEYLVGVDALADSSVNILLRAWVKSEDFLTTRLELNEQIKLELDANNISIPFPQMDVRISNS